MEWTAGFDTEPAYRAAMTGIPSYNAICSSVSATYAGVKSKTAMGRIKENVKKSTEVGRAQFVAPGNLF